MKISSKMNMNGELLILWTGQTSQLKKRIISVMVIVKRGIYITIRSKAEFLTIKKYLECVVMVLIICLIISGVLITVFIVSQKHSDSKIGKFFNRLNPVMAECETNQCEKREKREAQKREAKAKHPWFYMFKNLLIFILIVGLVFGLPVFAYKKILLDYNGTYAKDRFIYDSEEGLCMLVTYYPEYRTGGEKGFAVTHLPPSALFFPFGLLSSNDRERKGYDISDSKKILEAFQTKSTWGGSGLLSILSQLLGTESGSANSFDIGKHGKYFIIDGRNLDLDYEKFAEQFD